MDELVAGQQTHLHLPALNCDCGLSPSGKCQVSATRLPPGDQRVFMHSVCVCYQHVWIIEEPGSLDPPVCFK